mgnify:CR=1 FL=1
MATRKPRRTTAKAPKAGAATVARIAPARAAKAAAQRGLSLLKRLATDGAVPEVATVVYVHGIGNKPEASVLKCQWDTALFQGAMGDRTRMAYWVDRDRHPVPEAASCAGGDTLRDPADALGPRALAVEAGALDADDGLNAAERRILGAIEARVRSSFEGVAPDGKRGTRSAAARSATGAARGTGPAAASRGPSAKVLPLPEGLRRGVTRLLTKLFLGDVKDFLFDETARERMVRTVLDRLEGAGPCIVIGHSQGSMVAFEALRRLAKTDADVRLFVTIGSPLGLAEVQDSLKKRGRLATPECVARWLNVAERLDPVALDAKLGNDYAANGRGVKAEDHGGLQVNPDWKTNPHSGTGYLRMAIVRETVREVAGAGFSTVVGRAILMKDLVDAMEDGTREERHPALIQLVPAESKPGAEATVESVRAKTLARIESLVVEGGSAVAEARVQHLRRFISADLTRREIERLREASADIQVERVWRNAVKRALLHQSGDTVQARPARLGYGAVGAGVGWAVLDTGIAAGHPHFAKHANIVAQWDCTKTGAAVRLDPGAKGFDTLDGNGHGTHVAAIIAGTHSLPKEKGAKETIDLPGIAPEAKLYGFKVLADDGAGEDAFIIKALDEVARINEEAGRLVIHGVNLSLGGGFDPSVFGCGHTPLCQELRRLWRQGVLVVLAAGNEGYAVLETEDGAVPANMDLSIGDPANLEEAIAVGSVHKANPHTYGVSYFSSRGPTADGRRKPDLVAPGEKILSARHRWPKGADSARDLYVEMSGTSMAAPHVSGLLAAFLSARREFAGSPDRVKALLLSRCTDLSRDPYIQGAGMPNLVKMLMDT